MSSMDILSLTTPDKQFDYVLTLINKLEAKVEEKMASNQVTSSQKTTELEAKLASLTTKFDDIQTKFVTHKLKADKIDDFSLFINKANDQLTSHDIKLKNLSGELTDFNYKFDKLFVNNLTVPGFIGEQCQYKTLREYLEANIKELSSLVTFRDKTNLDFKQYKEKMEGLIKDFERQTKTFSSIQNSHFEELQKEIKVQIEELRREFFAKCDELNMENSKYAVELKGKTEGIKDEWEKMNAFRQEMGVRFDDAVALLQGDNNKAVVTVTGYKKEFQQMKEKLANLIEFIKDVRFRRNLVAFDVVKKREVFDLNEKIVRGKSPDPYSYSRNMDLNYELFNDKDFIKAEESTIAVQDNDIPKPQPKSKPKEEKVKQEPKSTQNKDIKKIITTEPTSGSKPTGDEKKKEDIQPKICDKKPASANNRTNQKFSSSDNVPKVSLSSAFKKANPLSQSVAKPAENQVVTLQIFNSSTIGFEGQESFDACIKPVPIKRSNNRFRTMKENQAIGTLLTKSMSPAVAGQFKKSTSKTKDAIDCEPKATKADKSTAKLLTNMPTVINQTREEDIDKAFEQFKVHK